jgi:hypothetical protein
MNAPARTKPVLDPIDRLSEIIFGLLMALSFTGTMSVAVGEANGSGACLRPLWDAMWHGALWTE